MAIQFNVMFYGGLISLLIFATATSGQANSTSNETVLIRINTTCYNMTYLLDFNANFRSQIVINEMKVLRSSNILYYSYEPEIPDKEYMKTAFVNLNDHKINGVITSAHDVLYNFGTFAIDQSNSVIYLGGGDGISKLDTKTNSFAHYSSHGDTIISIYYHKGNVYFVRDGENEIILKKGNEFDSVLKDDAGKTLFDMLPMKSVKKFVITKNNIVVYLTSFGLFASPLTKNSELVWLSKNAFFSGITKDLDDNVYVWWLDGLYKVVLKSKLLDSELERVAYLPGIGSMAFDNSNNILLTFEKSLYSLVKTGITDC